MTFNFAFPDCDIDAFPQTLQRCSKYFPIIVSKFSQNMKKNFLELIKLSLHVLNDSHQTQPPPHLVTPTTLQE